VKEKLDQLQQKLKYTFRNIALLQAAITHRSLPDINNERLEFLGDSIINFLIAETLYARWPEAQEGQLSRLRSSLVKGDTLAAIANEIQLGSSMRMGLGEIRTGGHLRTSILADATEATIAAIYLDSDLETCRRIIMPWFKARIDKLSFNDKLKDPKSRLQELLQGQQASLPDYKIIAITGEAHAQTFTIRCEVSSLQKSADGVGTSRRKAEQAAAENLLAQIEEDTHE